MQGRARRRAFEIIFFLGMLVLFYLVFNSLVSKDGSGVFSSPAAESQP